jgi:hypothetical protein
MKYLILILAMAISSSAYAKPLEHWQSCRNPQPNWATQTSEPTSLNPKSVTGGLGRQPMVITRRMGTPRVYFTRPFRRWLPA